MIDGHVLLVSLSYECFHGALMIHLVDDGELGPVVVLQGSHCCPYYLQVGELI